MEKNNTEIARNALKAIMLNALAIEQGINDFYAPLLSVGLDEETLDRQAQRAKETKIWAETQLVHLWK